MKHDNFKPNWPPAGQRTIKYVDPQKVREATKIVCEKYKETLRLLKD